MDIEEALFSHLESNAALGALIGSGDSCRMYPNRIPQGADFPALQYFLVSDASLRTGGGRRHPKPRYQFTAWAKTGDQARAVINALTLALDGFAGIMGGASGLEIQAALMDGASSGFDPERELASRSADFTIWHS